MIWLLALQLATGPNQDYKNAQHDLAENRLSEADREVDAALNSDPYFAPALVLKARLAIIAKRPDIAKKCLITAVTVDPSSADAQFYLGVFHYVQNDFKIAISPLQAARSLSPKDPMPPFYLALTEEALGNTPDAMTYYQLAEDLSPEKTPQASAILVAYGRFLYSSGKYKESIDREQRAVLANDDSRDAHYELAKGLSHQGDYTQSAREGERALALPASGTGTSDAEIHFLLSSIYRKLKQDDLAKEHFARFQEETKATTK